MPSVNETQLGNFIASSIDEKGWSIRKSALQIGVSAAYLSKLINHKADSNPKPKTLDKLADGLKVSRKDMYEAAGLSTITVTASESPQVPSNAIKFEKNNIAQVEIVGTIKCGPNGLAMEDYQGFEPTSLDDMAPGEEYFWLRTSGDSMIGDYIRDGDLALIQRTSGFDNGEICAIIVDGEEGTLKHITKKENSIVLTASNPIYPPRIFVGEEMDQIYVAGRLVETKHKY